MTPGQATGPADTFNYIDSRGLEYTETAQEIRTETRRLLGEARDILERYKSEPDKYEKAKTEYGELSDVFNQAFEDDNNLSHQELENLHAEVQDMREIGEGLKEQLADTAARNLDSLFVIFDDDIRDKNTILEALRDRTEFIDIKKEIESGGETVSALLMLQLSNIQAKNYSQMQNVINRTQEKYLYELGIDITTGFGPSYIQGYNNEVGNYVMTHGEFEDYLRNPTTRIIGQNEDETTVNSKLLASYLQQLKTWKGEGWDDHLKNIIGPERMVELGEAIENSESKVRKYLGDTGNWEILSEIEKLQQESVLEMQELLGSGLELNIHNEIDRNFLLGDIQRRIAYIKSPDNIIWFFQNYPDECKNVNFYNIHKSIRGEISVIKDFPNGLDTSDILFIPKEKFETPYISELLTFIAESGYQTGKRESVESTLKSVIQKSKKVLGIEECIRFLGDLFQQLTDAKILEILKNSVPLDMIEADSERVLGITRDIQTSIENLERFHENVLYMNSIQMTGAIDSTGAISSMVETVSPDGDGYVIQQNSEDQKRAIQKQLAEYIEKYGIIGVENQVLEMISAGNFYYLPSNIFIELNPNILSHREIAIAAVKESLSNMRNIDEDMKSEISVIEAIASHGENARIHIQNIDFNTPQKLFTFIRVFKENDGNKSLLYSDESFQEKARGILGFLEDNPDTSISYSKDDINIYNELKEHISNELDLGNILDESYEIEATLSDNLSERNYSLDDFIDEYSSMEGFQGEILAYINQEISNDHFYRLLREYFNSEYVVLDQQRDIVLKIAYLNKQRTSEAVVEATEATQQIANELEQSKYYDVSRESGFDYQTMMQDYFNSFGTSSTPTQSSFEEFLSRTDPNTNYSSEHIQILWNGFQAILNNQETLSVEELNEKLNNEEIGEVLDLLGEPDFWTERQEDIRRAISNGEINVNDNDSWERYLTQEFKKQHNIGDEKNSNFNNTSNSFDTGDTGLLKSAEGRSIINSGGETRLIVSSEVQIPLSSFDISAIGDNPEAEGNLIEFYKILQNLNLEEFWNYKDIIFQTISNKSATSGLNLNDTGYIDQGDMSLFLYTIADSISESPELSQKEQNDIRSMRGQKQDFKLIYSMMERINKQTGVAQNEDESVLRNEGRVGRIFREIYFSQSEDKNEQSLIFKKELFEQNLGN